jgi:hypothetical protein
MKKNRSLLLIAAAAALLIGGCAATPQQSMVKEVRVCAAGNCAVADHTVSAKQMLNGVQQLLKANEGEEVRICDSDPKTRSCESVGICQFVLGGGIPGNGCARGIVFSDIAPTSQDGQISLKADMPRTFIWTPMTCATMTGTLSVRSADEISVDFEPHYCNWMVVGNMTATFTFAVESLDLDRGQVGVYWSHAVSGTGIGSGSGYALLEFPKSMPRGQNWVVKQSMAPTPSAH